MDPVGVGAWEVATATVDMVVVTEAMVIAHSVGDTVVGDSDR
jgi:hypothetical protein